MAFITQFYDWSTGDTITASRLDGNITNIITGLNGGSNDINVGTVQLGSVEVLTSLREAVLTKATIDNVVIDGNDITTTAGVDLNITPLAGQQLVLDGTIIVDAGVVTGATSITSTAFVGALTGQADTVATITGLAPDTATTAAAQPNITSVGTLTSLTLSGAVSGVTTLGMSGVLTSTSTAIFGSTLSGGTPSGANNLVVESSGSGGMTLMTPDANITNLNFGNATGSNNGLLRYDYPNNEFLIGTNRASAKTILKTGAFTTALTLDGTTATFAGAVSGVTTLVTTGDIYTVTPTTWTQTFTSAGTNATFTTNNVVYKQVGKTVTVSGNLQNASGGTAGSGAGGLTFDVPVAMNTTWDNTQGRVGTLTTVNGGTFQTWYGRVVNGGVRFYSDADGGQIADDDLNDANVRQCHYFFSYEAA